MICLLLVGGYLCTLRLLARRAAGQKNFPVVAGILLVVFAMLGGTLLFAANLVGAQLVLLALLLLIALLMLCVTVVYLIGNFQALHLGVLTVFVVYLLALAYITLFSRSTAGDHTISLLRTDLLAEALRTHSLKPIRHIFQNVALFFPLGFLLPRIDPEKLDDPIWAVLVSLMLTVFIETTQMMLNLGQADLTDILANTAGGVLGYLVYRLLCRLGFGPQDEDE